MTGEAGRPIYARLNVNNFAGGADILTGFSVIKIKKHCNNMATMLPQNSFKSDANVALLSPDALASFKNVHALIKNMNTKQCVQLFNLTDKGTQYEEDIECHIHGPVYWSDVEEIVIDSHDLKFAPDMANLSVKQKQKLKKAIYSHAIEFQKRTGVKVIFNGFVF